MNMLLHVARPDDLAATAPGEDYRPAAFALDGFVHCCDEHQLPGVLTRWFEVGEPLTLLVLDAALLQLPVVHENLHGGEELFAHVYGGIRGDAIRQRLPFVAPHPPQIEQAST